MKIFSTRTIVRRLLLGVVCLGLAQSLRSEVLPAFQLLPQAQVDSAGIFLDQIVVAPTPSSGVIPHLRLAPSPIIGQATSLSRNQIIELAQKSNSGLTGLSSTNWSGATQVRVSRRTRQFDFPELLDLLTAALQREFVRTNGELELHLIRPWTPVTVPDEPLTLKAAEMPAGGISPNFVVSCELWCGKERVGVWPVALQASVWKDVPVAHTTLKRGELLRDADITMERRDVLMLRDVCPLYPTTEDTYELSENVSAGMPLLNHAVRPRPVIQRGRLVDAVFQDGALSISLKVETMEDGLIGQTVRVRNPKTKRELYGKVQNEQTVLINL